MGAQVIPFRYEGARELRALNIASRRSPWLITPAEHREYRRRATGVA